MRYQDQLVKVTQRSLDDLLRSVKSMPADRLDWQPAESARSALDLLREIAVSASWFLALAKGEHVDGGTGEEHRRREEQRMACLKTVEDCEREARRATSELCALVSGMGTEEMEQEVSLPFGGGMTVTKADLFGMHHAHIVYHTGQVNYLQTLYGDLEMH